MKSKHKDIDGSRKLFEISLTGEIVKKKYEEIYNHIRKIAQVPGYRAGKVPRDILEKHHGHKIKEEAIQDLVSHSYREAVGESKTEVIGLPEISDLTFDIEKGMFFKVKVDTRPKVSLKRYKAIPVKKQKVDVKDDDVTKYLGMLAESNANFTDILDRTARMGDYVVCDLECVVEGKAIHPKRKGVWVAVDKNNPVPGLTDGITGMKKDEERDINTTLPKNFQETKYRNKPAVFKIKLLDIKEKKLPEINDEFAKKLGGKNIEDLKKIIKEDLKRKLESRIRMDMENQILGLLIKENNFHLPKNLVEKEAKRITETKKEKTTPEKAKEEAERRVRLYFILDEISRREKIEASDKELDSLIESLSREYGKTKDEMTNHYKKNHLLESLKDQIRENKVVNFLIDNANVKE